MITFESQPQTSDSNISPLKKSFCCDKAIGMYLSLRGMTSTSLVLNLALLARLYFSGFIFVKTIALNFAIQAFSTSFYFPKCLHFWRLTKDIQRIFSNLTIQMKMIAGFWTIYTRNLCSLTPFHNRRSNIEFTGKTIIKWYVYLSIHVLYLLWLL